MAMRICFAALLLTTTTFATASRVQLVRSALDDDTTLIGEPVVFTCSITNGIALQWRWNDDEELIQNYVPDNHQECGERERYMPGVITTAEIHSVLAVVVNDSDGTANCTSLLEIKPIIGFSSVNISCVGLFRNGSGGTTFTTQSLPLNAGNANVLLFTSSIEGRIISTNESATFTCRVSAKSLQWSYKRNDMSTPVIIETHNTTDRVCDNKNRHPNLINHTDVFSLLASSDRAGDITSILEITHKSAFTGVTVYCTATAADGKIVKKNFTFDITEAAMTTQDQATSSSVTTEPTTTTPMTTQATSGFQCGTEATIVAAVAAVTAAVIVFFFGILLGCLMRSCLIRSKPISNNRTDAEKLTDNFFDEKKFDTSAT